MSSMASDGYVSTIRVDGRPILSPIMTAAKMEEMRRWRDKAVQIEKHLKDVAPHPTRTNDRRRLAAVGLKPVSPPPPASFFLPPLLHSPKSPSPPHSDIREDNSVASTIRRHSDIFRRRELKQGMTGMVNGDAPPTATAVDKEMDREREKRTTDNQDVSLAGFSNYCQSSVGSDSPASFAPETIASTLTDTSGRTSEAIDFEGRRAASNGESNADFMLRRKNLVDNIGPALERTKGDVDGNWRVPPSRKDSLIYLKHKDLIDRVDDAMGLDKKMHIPVLPQPLPPSYVAPPSPILSATYDHVRSILSTDGHGPYPDSDPAHPQMANFQPRSRSLTEVELERKRISGEYLKHHLLMDSVASILHSGTRDTSKDENDEILHNRKVPNGDVVWDQKEKDVDECGRRESITTDIDKKLDSFSFLAAAQGEDGGNELAFELEHGVDVTVPILRAFLELGTTREKRKKEKEERTVRVEVGMEGVEEEENSLPVQNHLLKANNEAETKEEIRIETHLAMSEKTTMGGETPRRTDLCHGEEMVDRMLSDLERSHEQQMEELRAKQEEERRRLLQMVGDQPPKLDGVELESEQDLQEQEQEPGLSTLIPGTRSSFASTLDGLTMEEAVAMPVPFQYLPDDTEPEQEPVSFIYIPDKALDANMNRIWCRLSALAKGYLTRKLLRTDKIQNLIREIRDTASVAYGLLGDKANDDDAVALKQRLITQLRNDVLKFHGIFFSLPVRQRMAIIAYDRAAKREKTFRKPPTRTMSTSNRPSSGGGNNTRNKEQVSPMKNTPNSS